MSHVVCIVAQHVLGELWVSLASLLRSYTAAHGLNGNRQADGGAGRRTDYGAPRRADGWTST